MLKICLYHGDLHSNLWKSVLHFRPAVLYVTIVFVPRVSPLCLHEVELFQDGGRL